MKRSILFLLIIVAIANICNAQSYEFKNLKCFGTSDYDIHPKIWTIDSLTIYDRGAGYVVCAKLYNVKESKYVEIPNDTTRIKFTKCLRKYTRKDGTGYEFIDSDGNWKIAVRTIGRLNYVSVEIKHKTYGAYGVELKKDTYDAFETFTPEEFEKCLIDEKGEKLTDIIKPKMTENQ